MRLAKISTTEQANDFLPLFLKEFNQKFTKPAKNPSNAHRPLIDDQDLDKVFCLKHTRRISKNLILQYKGVLYQIYANGLEYTLRQKDVTVIEYEDGEVHFENNGKRLKAIPYKEVEGPTEIVSSKELLTVLAKQPSKGKERYKPGPHHPWKQSVSRKSRVLAYT